MTEIPLSRRAKLNSFALLQHTPRGFPAPAFHASVELPEGPRLFTTITGCPLEEDALKVGQEVELVIEKLTEDEAGNQVIGWKFRPVGGEK